MKLDRPAGKEQWEESREKYHFFDIIQFRKQFRLFFSWYLTYARVSLKNTLINWQQ